MTVLGQQLTTEGARNLLLAGCGIAGGTTTTILSFVYEHQKGILFILAVSSYILAMYASIKHIQSLKQKK